MGWQKGRCQINIGSGNGLLPEGTKLLINQCWFLIFEVLWHSSEGSITVSTLLCIVYNKFKKYTFKITATPSGGQRINMLN